MSAGDVVVAWQQHLDRLLARRAVPGTTVNTDFTVSLLDAELELERAQLRAVRTARDPRRAAERAAAAITTAQHTQLRRKLAYAPNAPHLPANYSSRYVLNTRNTLLRLTELLEAAKDGSLAAPTAADGNPASGSESIAAAPPSSEPPSVSADGGSDADLSRTASDSGTPSSDRRRHRRRHRRKSCGANYLSARRAPSTPGSTGSSTLSERHSRRRRHRPSGLDASSAGIRNGSSGGDGSDTDAESIATSARQDRLRVAARRQSVDLSCQLEREGAAMLAQPPPSGPPAIPPPPLRRWSFRRRGKGV